MALRTEGGNHELQEAKERVAFLVETLQMTEDQMAEQKRLVELGKAKEQQWERKIYSLCVRMCVMLGGFFFCCFFFFSSILFDGLLQQALVQNLIRSARIFKPRLSI